jgi:hypothetical protein
MGFKPLRPRNPRLEDLELTVEFIPLLGTRAKEKFELRTASDIGGAGGELV